jgi:hypothetical protein
MRYRQTSTYQRHILSRGFLRLQANKLKSMGLFGDLNCAASYGIIQAEGLFSVSSSLAEDAAQESKVNLHFKPPSAEGSRGSRT